MKNSVSVSLPGVFLRRNLVCTFGVLSLVLLPSLSLAQTTWTNETSGSWTEIGNWSDGFPAASGTSATAVISNSGTAVLSIGSLGEYDTLNLGAAPSESGAVEVSGGALSGIVTFIGNSGSGSLLLTSGTVSSMFGFVGFESGGSGTATVNGGVWENTSQFSVGYFGEGSLVLTNGLIANDTAYVGQDSTGNGSVLVSGGTMVNNNSFYVGYSGTGALNLTNGMVTNASVDIGYEASGDGSVLISGGTLAASVGLTVGRDGAGSLTISGGLVTADGVGLSLNGPSSGAIVLSGDEENRGVLEATAVSKGGGDGTLSFDGGILRAKENQNNLLSGFDAGDVILGDGGAFVDSNGFDVGVGVVLSGSGALTKQGAGQLALSGSNTYSGGTVVAAGTVSVGHNEALGTGGVMVETGATLSIQTGFSATNQVTLAGGTLEQGVASGGSLAGTLAATSHFAGGKPDTSAILLAGTTSAATTITASFSATSGANNDEIRRSDVLHLSGIPVVSGDETDIFVLELSMTAVDPGSYLGWLNGANEWVNAALGNTGNNASGDQLGYNGSFAEFQMEYADLLLSEYIGAWGFTDTSVWAVLNHNSAFGVVPEPATSLLVLLGSGGLFLRRRR